VFAVDRGFACNVTGMPWDIARILSGFDPVNWPMMMAAALGAFGNDPDVDVISEDPGPGMADSPVIGMGEGTIAVMESESPVRIGESDRTDSLREARIVRGYFRQERKSIRLRCHDMEGEGDGVEDSAGARSDGNGVGTWE
jgi:hypothetical protein